MPKPNPVPPGRILPPAPLPPGGRGGKAGGAGGKGIAPAGKRVAGPGVGFGVAQPAFFSNFTGVTLRDEKGRVLPANVQYDFEKGFRGIGPGQPVDYKLVYKPEKAHGKPAKLVYAGR
jgi:hypothetical protein